MKELMQSEGFWSWVQWAFWSGTVAVMSLWSYRMGVRNGREEQRKQGIEDLEQIHDVNDRVEAPRDPDAPGARIHDTRWTNGYW